MKTIRIPHTELEVARIAHGCMNLGRKWNQEPPSATDLAAAGRLIAAACEQGITLFDHADIYARGKSEAVFGEVLRQSPGLRDRIVLQSKCGIRFSDDPQPGVPSRYDFSAEHILRAVEGSLQRLQTDHLDVLLLHRPDPLVEPEEVATAFDRLRAAGKVSYFGVSNHNASQLALLQKHLDAPLVINQLQLSLLHADLIGDGVVVNNTAASYTAATGILDYCRLHNVMVQAWSPLARGALVDPPERAEERVKQAARVVAQLAELKCSSRVAIALAWILRHPAGIQPIVGTTNPVHLAACCEADRITLSREEWYALLVAARGAPVP